MCGDSGGCDTVDFSAEIGGGVEVRGNGVRRQTRVISIAGRIVAPKGRCGVEVLVHSAKQIDIRAVGCAAEPATRRRQRGDRRPTVRCGRVLIRVCDSGVADDTAETIDVATY